MQDAVDRIRRGDPSGLEALVARFEPRLLRLAAAFLGDRADAEEAAQDAFVSAWRGISGYRDGTDLEAWLVTICLNACRMRRRRAAPARGVLPAAGPRSEAFDPVEEQEGCQALIQAISELPDREKEAFLLMEMEGYPSATASIVMGCAPESARMALARARRSLKAMLQERGFLHS